MQGMRQEREGGRCSLVDREDENGGIAKRVHP